MEKEYENSEKISIDYGLMEKIKDVKVIEADFVWDDVGTWKAIERSNKQDDRGNTIIAKHTGINTANCIVVGKNEHLITTVNVSNLIIVQTERATLICNKENDGDIKELVKKLKEGGFDNYL